MSPVPQAPAEKDYLDESQLQTQGKTSSSLEAPQVLCLLWRTRPWDGRTHAGAPITPPDSGKTSDRKGTAMVCPRIFLWDDLHLVMTRWLMHTLVIFQAGFALECLATIRAVQLFRAEIMKL